MKLFHIKQNALLHVLFIILFNFKLIRFKHVKISFNLPRTHTQLSIYKKFVIS